MGLPTNRLLALGFGAAGVAVTGTLLGPAAGAVTGVVSSILSNFFATLAQPGVTPPGESPESLIRNHDLRKLVGIAIRNTILLEKVDADRANRLASGAVELWMSDSAAADTMLAPLNEQSSAAYFATDEINFDNQKALDEPAWRTFLVALAASTSTELPDPLRDRLAESLCDKLPQMLRAVVKKDFTGDTEAQGRGFASLQLVLMGKIVSGIDQLLEQQARPSDDVLKEIRAFNARVPDVVARHDARVKDPRERAVLSKVLEQINQLRPHLDKRLDELTRAVASEGIKTRTEVRGVDRKVVYVLGGIALLLVVSFSQWHLMRWDLARSEATVRAAIAELNSGTGPTAGEISREVLAAAKFLQECGSPEQKDLAAIIVALESGFDKAKLMIVETKGKAIKTYEAGRRQWEEKRNALGKAWDSMPTGNRAEDLAKSIAAYEAELEVHTRENFPANWARMQHSLGIAWAELPTGNRTENLAKAIAAYKAALTVYTVEAYPAESQSIRVNLSASQLLTKDFAGALATAEAAQNVTPQILSLETKRAHALLFLDRVDEARAIYLKHAGEMIDDKTWQAVILEDFDALEKEGLTHPQMNDLREALRAAE